MVIKHVWGGGRCVFVCLDACVARREQMVETQQTVGEHHTEGEGNKKKKKRRKKRGPSCTSTQFLSAKKLHTREHPE